MEHIVQEGINTKKKNSNLEAFLKNFLHEEKKKNDTYVMEQNFDLFRWLSGNLRHVFLPQKLFCQYDPECDRGIDKTLGSISAVSPSIGGSFSRTAAYNRA